MKPLLLLAVCALSLSAAAITSGTISIGQHDGQVDLFGPGIEIHGILVDLEGGASTCIPCEPGGLVFPVQFSSDGSINGLEYDGSLFLGFTPFSPGNRSTVVQPFWMEGIIGPPSAESEQFPITTLTGGGHVVFSFTDPDPYYGLVEIQSQTYYFTPEPGTYVLMMIGSLLLLFARIFLALRYHPPANRRS